MTSNAPSASLEKTSSLKFKESKEIFSPLDRPCGRPRGPVTKKVIG